MPLSAAGATFAAFLAAAGLSPHEIAVKQFASTMAIIQVASDRCVDILINMPMLAQMRVDLGVGIDDAPTVAAERVLDMEVLSRAITQAPNLQAWCDAAYRLYGPDGALIPALMARQRSVN